jgi:Polyketide cyclase / dehydrase and lipid transport
MLAGMTSLTSDIVIAAPADRVWRVVAHRFDSIGDWATAISASTAPGSAVATAGAPVAGRICDTGIPAVPHVTETIVAYDEAARTLTYEATAGMPAFVALARNTWRVTPLDDTRTVVSYAARLEVRGLVGRLGRWWLLAQARRTGRHLLDDLKHYVEHGVPSPRKQRRTDRSAMPPVTERSNATEAVVVVGSRPSTGLLRAALRANAVFSMVSGALLVGFGALVAGPWRLGPPPLLPLLGAGVAVFGVALARLAVASIGPLRRGAAAVIAADVGWVAGSGVLLVGYRPAAPGGLAVAAVAAVVTGLAGWQLAGLIRARSDDRLADVEVVEAATPLPDEPAAVWPVLTDHRLYGRLAPNLSNVEVLSEGDQPLRRRCTSTTGREWEETCTLWQDGHRFAVEVDTGRYPYPIAAMSGLWQVDPRPGGSRVVMRFAYRAIPSIRGGLFAIALRALAPLALHRIFHGWRAELASNDRRHAGSAEDRQAARS